RCQPREEPQKEQKAAEELRDGEGHGPEAGGSETDAGDHLGRAERVGDLRPAVDHQGDAGDHPQDGFAYRSQAIVEAREHREVVAHSNPSFWSSCDMRWYL